MTKSTHRAEPRDMGVKARQRVAVGLGQYRCKCGREIIEVAKPGVPGFGDDAFTWRHLPRKATKR